MIKCNCQCFGRFHLTFIFRCLIYITPSISPSTEVCLFLLSQLSLQVSLLLYLLTNIKNATKNLIF
jgi:hypothetical protein